MNTHTLSFATSASSTTLTPSSPTSAPRGKSSPRAERTVAERKLLLLKRSGLFGTDTKGATVTRAVSFEDLRDAYRLVHEVYVGTGYIHPEPAGMRLRVFETTSETATFVAKVNGRVVGVLSAVGDSVDFGLPSDSAFRVELDALRATGARLCEVTNQAVAEEYRHSAVPTELMRCAVAHSMKAGYHDIIATVSPSHNGFYELMNFRKVGSERSYSQKLHDPVVALAMNLDWYRRPIGCAGEAEQFMHHFFVENNPFQACVASWVPEARRRFLDADLLQRLFVLERNFLAECSPEQLLCLRRRWGRELFEAVAGDDYLAPEMLLTDRKTMSAEQCANDLVAQSAPPFEKASPDLYHCAVAGNLPRVSDVLRHYLAKAFVRVVARSTDGESEVGMSSARKADGHLVALAN